MFKPMLAPGEDPLSFPDYFKKLQYPLLCSPKYDGVRAVIKGRKAMSRSFKILPSYQVQDEFSEFEHFDGEIIEGNSTDFNVYNRTQSHVMSANKPGNLTYFVFDYTHPEFLNKPFHERLEFLEWFIGTTFIGTTGQARFVPHEYVETYEELIVYEKKCLAQGFEGIMMRDPMGFYKPGRGTFREGLIYKLKRFKDAEGLIVDILPMMVNNNELQTDELGYAKRSSSKAGLEEGDIAGKYVVFFEGMHLDIAPGAFTHGERYEMLQNKEKYVGKKHLKFRFFNHGVKDKPRFPRAIGLRETLDL
jgi:DNA ligase-1